MLVQAIQGGRWLCVVPVLAAGSVEPVAFSEKLAHRVL